MEIQWPKTCEEWLTFDLTKVPIGTAMPFKTEVPPEKYIVNGLLRTELIPEKERHRYFHPCQRDEPDIPRNADGSIKIVDKKQEQIDYLTKQLESLPEAKQLLQLEEQQKTINALMAHVATLTNQMNDITKNITK